MVEFLNVIRAPPVPASVDPVPSSSDAPTIPVDATPSEKPARRRGNANLLDELLSDPLAQYDPDRDLIFEVEEEDEEVEEEHANEEAHEDGDDDTDSLEAYAVPDQERVDRTEKADTLSVRKKIPPMRYLGDVYDALSDTKDVERFEVGLNSLLDAIREHPEHVGLFEISFF